MPPSTSVACTIAILALAFAVPPRAAAQEAAEAKDDCSGLFCQLGKAISDGAKQGMGGKSFGEAVSTGVQDGLAGKTPQVLGHVVLGNGGYLTFFDNNPGGFPSNGRPLSQAPRPGTVPPAMVLVPVAVKNGKSFEGAMLANNIEVMKQNGVFVAAATPRAAAPAAAADESTRSVPRILAIEKGQKYQTSVDNCRVFDELGPGDKPTGRQVRLTGALFDAAARCETRLSAFRREQMDALEKEAQAATKK